MEYRIFIALRDDLNEGWVWIHQLQSQLGSRDVVRISRGKKRIYCEALKIDRNYVNLYGMSCPSPPLPLQVQQIANNDVNNEKIEFSIEVPEGVEGKNLIAVNEWYRKLLNIEPQTDCDLDIKIPGPIRKRFWGVRASLQHPQVVVGAATWLGIIGFWLGIIGLLLGVAGVVLGILPLIKRST
ncbi:MAG TPA: hypothetical protein VK582_08970 [Pyrinomonadaceae bacterium]|nr:hypothetical protein [Pyrinomonadaceae bacterium]